LLPKEEPTLAPPLVEPAKVEYDTTKVKRDTIIRRVKGVAEFSATDKRQLSFNESGGRISKISVENGDEVQEGDVLLQLTSGDLAFRVKQTEIMLEKADLNIKHLEAQDAEDYAIKKAELD